MQLLEIRDLKVQMGAGMAPILRGLSLSMRAGERIAVVGQSGAGKTTLFRAINGTVPVTSGVLRFEGDDVAACRGNDLRRLRRRIAVIAQKHDLVDSLRVHQNVMAGLLGAWSAAHALRYLVWPQRDELAQAEAALAAVGLARKLRERTANLSGGEQQRVAIARALVQSPHLILADEPVASLDPDTANDILELLTRLAQQKGVALLCSLHQPELAARFFDRTIEIRDGQSTERPFVVRPTAAVAV